MPDKEDEVVNVALDPEEALRLLLAVDLRDPKPKNEKDPRTGDDDDAPPAAA